MTSDGNKRRINTLYCRLLITRAVSDDERPAVQSRFSEFVDPFTAFEIAEIGQLKVSNEGTIVISHQTIFQFRSLKII